MLTDFGFQFILVSSPKQSKIMSKENRLEEVDFPSVPLPKFVRFRDTGKVYRIDESNSEEVLMTQIHPDTHSPVPGGKISSTRQAVCKNAKPYPFADTEFFADLSNCESVKETATGRVYKIKKFDFDNDSVVLVDENDKLTPMSVENLYSSFSLIKTPEIVCRVCKLINEDTKKTLH